MKTPERPFHVSRHATCVRLELFGQPVETTPSRVIDLDPARNGQVVTLIELRLGWLTLWRFCDRGSYFH